MLTLTTDTITAAEGDEFTFTISGVSDATTLNWVIRPTGFLPIGASDFSSFTGSLNLTSGQTSFTLPASVENTVFGPDRSFEIDFYQGVVEPDKLIGTVTGTITDDDTRPTSSFNVFADSNKNVVTIGTVNALTAGGFGGDDYIVITPYNYGNITIDDLTGVNTIIFDGGVEITRIHEDIVDYRAFDIEAVSLQFLIGGSLVPHDATERIGREDVVFTLSTGGTITIDDPSSGVYQYQIGNGQPMSYLEFLKAIAPSAPSAPPQRPALGTTEPVRSTLEVDISYTVSSYVDASDFDQGEIPESNSRFNFFASSDIDILHLGGENKYIANGLGGDDYIVVSRFLTADATIQDLSGTNTIIFDHGVGITRVEEELNDLRGSSRSLDFFKSRGGIPSDATVKVGHTSVVFTLSTGARITIDDPALAFYQYQIGDGEILSYLELRKAIGLGLPDPDNPTQTISYTVPFPASSADVPAPVPELLLGDTLPDTTAGDLANTEVATLNIKNGAIADYTFTVDNDKFEVNSENKLILKAGDYAVGTVSVTITATKGDKTLTEILSLNILSDTGKNYLRWVDNEVTLTTFDGTEFSTFYAGLYRFHEGAGDTEFYLPWENQAEEDSFFLGNNLVRLDSNLPDSSKDIEIDLLAGNDVYRIERGFDSDDIVLADTEGDNIIIFAEGVVVKTITSTIAVSDHGNIVSKAVLTIDTDGSNAEDIDDSVELTILTPQGHYSFYDENDVTPIFEDFKAFSDFSS
jgi:hypothetical protein